MEGDDDDTGRYHRIEYPAQRRPTYPLYLQIISVGALCGRTCPEVNTGGVTIGGR